MTKREYEVALLVMQGLTNKAIAFQLGITAGTVKMHLHHIYTDTGLENRTELAMAVREAEDEAAFLLVDAALATIGGVDG